MDIANLPYYETVHDIRRFFEETQKNFPHNYCIDASHLIARETELFFIAGKFFTGTYEDEHAWNFDARRGLYVDITQDQYVWISAPVIITKPFTSRLAPSLGSTLAELVVNWPLEKKGHNKLREEYREHTLVA